jgi:Ca-activated chloride channel family protein
VGVTEKKDFLSLLEQHDVRLFTFVMGNSANRPLLEGMTKVSNGFAMNISNSDDIVGRLVQTADKLSHEAYRDIDIDISGVKVKDVTPARIGSLYRGQQLIIFGHYWGDGPAKVEISGKVSDRDVDYKTRFNFPGQSTLNPEIERLWAYASIEDLQNRIDYLGADSDSEQAIVDLATEYGLVTDYTSMVVVRDEVFKQYNIDRNNAARIANEHQAREQREAAPVRNHRRDAQQPAFNTPRAYPKSGGNGGGAMGPWALVILLPLLLSGKRKSLIQW